MDHQTTRNVPTRLVNHDIASKFFSTSVNIPWIKEPVCFIEDDDIYVVYDPLNKPVTADTVGHESFRITYIKRPMMFVKDLSTTSNLTGNLSYFSYDSSDATKDWPTAGAEGFEGTVKVAERYEFECNSTMAEELISLAVAFALENVESQRLNAKLNMRGLEA